MTDIPRARQIDTQVRLARAVVENLRPGELAAELCDGDVVLVDVREPDELGSGTIDGAISVPRGLVEFVADPDSLGHRAELDPARRMVVFCDSGARSALVVHALYALGYRDVAHLDGGLAAWVADGRAVVPGWCMGRTPPDEEGRSADDGRERAHPPPRWVRGCGGRHGRCDAVPDPSFG